MTMPSFETKQAVSKAAEGQWNWSVWIEGSNSDLDEVELVRYLLHASFPEPIQVRADRVSKFKLDETGWGEFTLKLEVKLRSGTTLRLRHNLRFEGDHLPRKAPRIFISGGASDLPELHMLTGSLEREGVEVVSAHDVAPGEVWRDAIDNKIELSDLMVALVSSPLSRAVMQELAVARSRDIPVKIVTLGGASDLQLEASSIIDVQDTQVINVEREDPQAMKALAHDVASFVRASDWHSRG